MDVLDFQSAGLGSLQSVPTGPSQLCNGSKVTLVLLSRARRPTWALDTSAPRPQTAEKVDCCASVLFEWDTTDDCIGRSFVEFGEAKLFNLFINRESVSCRCLPHVFQCPLAALTRTPRTSGAKRRWLKVPSTKSSRIHGRSLSESTSVSQALLLSLCHLGLRLQV